MDRCAVDSWVHEWKIRVISQYEFCIIIKCVWWERLKLNQKLIFQHNNYLKHYQIHQGMAQTRRNGEWSSQSPNLNPIQMLCGIWKGQFIQEKPQTFGMVQWSSVWGQGCICFSHSTPLIYWYGCWIIKKASSLDI